MAVDDSSGPAPSGATPTISPSSSNRGTGLVRKDSISIEDALSRPGSVRINVQGAYIVDASPAVVNGSESGQADTQDIRLPNHHGPVSHLSIDIGGSLIKLVYYNTEQSSTSPGGRLHFLTWRSDQIEACIGYMASLIRRLSPQHSPDPSSSPVSKPLSTAAASQSSQNLVVVATGGGAYKYNNKIKDALGVEVLREDEMECLALGLDFFLTEIPREVFTFHRDDMTDPVHFVPQSPLSLYPYLLVNVGSGVSLIKCSGPSSFERVGGTALGGGSFWGLASLLTGTASFEEILMLADEGDNAPVDLLVGDIYGTEGYNKIGLDSSIIASSFGKVYAHIRDETDSPSVTTKSKDPHAPPHASSHSPPKKADVARSLLFAMSNNIGQIACLHAQLFDLPRIYFGGSFVRHRQILSTLTFAIDFYSQGKKKAYFLRHNGFLGSVGAFLKTQPKGFGRRASMDLGDGDGHTRLS